MKNIDLMIKGKLEHSNIFLAEEISCSGSDSPYGYGEFNGNIITCINDICEDGDRNFAVITDNVIKFIDYKPSKLANKNYHSIVEKDFNFKLLFSYHIIFIALNNKDEELLELEWKRIGIELDNFLMHPYKMFKEDEKGIQFAIMFYFLESIHSFCDNYSKDKINEYLIKYHKLEEIYS